jgi:hypothetical protein
MWLEEYEELLFSMNHTDESTVAATRLKNQNMPEVVYKYRIVNKDNLQALGHEILIAASPKLLNDPNEGELYLDIGKRWAEFYKEFLQLFYKETGLRLAIRVEDYADRDSFIKDLADCMGIYRYEFESFDTMWAISDKLLKDRLLQFQKEIRSVGDQIYRICSLSANLNSRAMWTHYADSYRGFCIAYDFKRLGTDLTDLLLPIRYKEEQLDMDDSFFGDRNINNSFIINALTRKSLEWSYEKEWRLLLHTTSSESILKVRAPKPINVILGKDISDIDKEKLLQIADFLDVTCLQQRFNDMTGDFVYEPIANE